MKGASMTSFDALAPKVRVVHIIDGLNMDGGQKALYHLTRHLDSERYETSVISLSAKVGGLSAFRQAGVSVTPLMVDGIKEIYKLRRLRACLSVAKPDIVQTHLRVSNVVGKLVARSLKVPIVISTIQNEYPRSAWPFMLLDRWFAPITDQVVAVSEPVKRLVIEKERVPEERVTCIHNSVDIAECDRAAELPILPQIEQMRQRGDLIIAVVGRLTVQKGHRYLLEATRSVIDAVPKAHFVLVGQGELREKLCTLARDLGVADHVTFLGQLPPDVTLRLLWEADLFAMPSLWEGLSLALLEAMATKTAVVATKVSGALQVVVPGCTGMLVPPQDPAMLGEAIVKLLQDPVLRRQMGDRARRRVEDEFSVQYMVSSTEALYERLLRQKCQGRKGL